MKVLIVAGARPNFMKVAPVLRALTAAGHEGVLVHTGQHYDAAMSDSFFRDLGIPAPDFHLGVGSGSHAQQTARVMERFEPVLVEVSPDWVVVVGDVNSTLACALVAVKLKHQVGCRIAHVEAGLRSGDWRMPEEINRVITDRLSDLLLLPSHDARSNLEREGLDTGRAVMVGNVMIDSLLAQLAAARGLGAVARRGLTAGGYALVTLHRPSNVDDPAILRSIVDGLGRIAKRLPIVFPIHPRTRRTIESADIEIPPGVTIEAPASYLEMVALIDGAGVVLTDSGGLQEETTALGVPCVTLREQTERPITIAEGTNRLAPWPLSAPGIVSASESALAMGRQAPGSRVPDGWDGSAAERIVLALESASGNAADDTVTNRG